VAQKFSNLNRFKSQIDLLMETPANQFSNSDMTLTYDPTICINAGRCARELSDVFRTSVIPWIDLDGAPSQQIIEQIRRCPSGALKFRLNQKVA
jgi:uncharacterized Fe-S cluster protein YjdI